MTYKYCIAQVNTVGGKHEVSFYAADETGLYRLSDWNDPCVIWYDTEDQAVRNIMNRNECVLPRLFEDENGRKQHKGGLQ